MKTALFSDSAFEQMAGEVRRLLGEVGYVVDHPEMKALALRGGCRESADGRVLFENGQIEALGDELRRQYPPPKPDAPERSLVHPQSEAMFHFGNLTPKIFNYEQNRPEGGTTKAMLDLVKFAHVDPRVRFITLPLSRQDTPPALQELEAVWLMAKTTSKPLGGVDATVPETVPYLAEMAEALGYNPAAFVGCCNCINPPLRLEARTAETMLQRRRHHSRSMITSMPSIGGSGPVDIYGGIVLATAEIVGGLVLSMLMDPQAPLLGYIACIQVDMRTGNATSSTPQTVRLDAGVFQLMHRCFGGGTSIGGRSYVSARRPGLQATYERFLKAAGYSVFADGHAFYLAVNGNLDNGSMVSPEQFLLDMDMAQGLDWLHTAPNVPPAGDAVARIREAMLNGGGNFLTSEHTLAHYRDEMWPSACFPCLSETRSEKEILDRCHEQYRRMLADYQPASQPARTVAELEKILAKARRNLENCQT